MDVLNDSHLFMLSDSKQVLIDNLPAAAIAAAVDGRRTMPEVVGIAAMKVGPGAAFAAARSLMSRRYLVDDVPVECGWSEYLEARGLVHHETATQLAQTRLVIHGATLEREAVEVRTLIDEAHTYLTKAGLDVTVATDLQDTLDQARAGRAPLVLAEDYIHADLPQINELMLELGAPWAIAKPWGQSIWVGPVFTPGQGACWDCLRDRLTANRQSERYLAERLGRLPSVPSSGLFPGAVTLAASQVLSALVARLNGEANPLAGTIRTVEMNTLEARAHAVLQLTTCPVCGGGEPLRTDEVDLAPVEASSLIDGGYRVCTPDETVSRLEHHVSPISGAVSKIESLGVDTDGVTFSFAAGHNFAVVSDSLRMLSQNLRGQSGGKGRTRQQAKASALCEAIERFSGVWTPSVPAVRARYDELEGRKIHPADVLLFSDAQYGERSHLEFEDSKFHRVPERFDESIEIDFTPTRSLTTGEQVLVPAGLLWYGVPDLIKGPQYAYTDSNGQAAGNTLEEAILQGMCEVAERDAVGTWWFNRINRPGIDMDSFNDPYIKVLREFYERRDRNFWALDLSNDLGMHVFAALSKRDHAQQDIMLGFGAHPDPSVALFRALTELNQFLPFVDARDDDGNTIYGTDDQATIEWCQNATLDTEPWVLPHADLPARRLADMDTPATTRIDELVSDQVAKFAAAGVETIVANQTRPEIELSVVKVITPGLRHFWRRAAPGRLYDTPVNLGWSATALTEDQLNPRSVFF
ncbi:MAG: TOMM precursor leader peptide-binding protein [Propionibacteriaceae bacterium]|nr:TOMM precursor leader peptide-binding protein [Propionibacteriaceae bacterium]